MKFLKYLGLGVVGIIVLILITASFLKKDYNVERDITISKPKDSVFAYIKYLKNQGNYSKWAKMDPNSKMEYKGTDGTVGFSYTWNSQIKDVGQGEQTIKKIVENESIDYELHFIKPFEGLADAYLTTETVGNNQTKVRWGFTGHMKYPFNIFLLVMNMDKLIGDDLSVGLTNLKGILDK